MTLTEFLEARIAERESAARDMKHQAAMGRPLLQLLGGGTGIREIVDPDRVLADCKAKRRIVEQAAEWAALCPPDDWPEGGMEGAPLSDAGRWILRQMSLPYADHPDYRDEWRP